MERVTMFKGCYFGEVFKTSKECEEFETYVRNIGGTFSIICYKYSYLRRCGYIVEK